MHIQLTNEAFELQWNIYISKFYLLANFEQPFKLLAPSAAFCLQGICLMGSIGMRPECLLVCVIVWCMCVYIILYVYTCTHLKSLFLYFSVSFVYFFLRFLHLVLSFFSSISGSCSLSNKYDNDENDKQHT